MKHDEKYNLLCNIIDNGLVFIKNPSEDNQEHLISSLRSFSKHYHIILKELSYKKNKQPLFLESFRKFILNEEGYNFNINNLYNSILFYGKTQRINK